jgi:hypothetical protein
VIDDASADLSLAFVHEDLPGRAAESSGMGFSLRWDEFSYDTLAEHLQATVCGNHSVWHVVAVSLVSLGTDLT